MEEREGKKNEHVVGNDDNDDGWKYQSERYWMALPGKAIARSPSQALNKVPPVQERKRKAREWRESQHLFPKVSLFS